MPFSGFLASRHGGPPIYDSPMVPRVCFALSGDKVTPAPIMVPRVLDRLVVSPFSEEPLAGKKATPENLSQP
jgi:hypothetical protein